MNYDTASGWAHRGALTNRLFFLVDPNTADSRFCTSFPRSQDIKVKVGDWPALVSADLAR